MTISIKDNYIYVGEKGYAIEKKLQKKLDRIVKGVTQSHPAEDAVLINEGKEGKGKTNVSVFEATYLKARTGREVHLFFRLEAMMNYAKVTKEKIIIWDEPSLDSLSRDQLNEMNINMQRFFMTIRKKRHIFLINYTKFWKFPEYLVVDRADGMVHMSESKIGRIFYIRKKKLEFLWNDFRTRHKRSYLKASSFGGYVPDFMRKEFNNLGIFVNAFANATIDIYESEKDIAIESIGVKKSKREIQREEREHKLFFAIGKLPGTWAEKSALTGMNLRNLKESYALAIQKRQMEGDVSL